MSLPAIAMESSLHFIVLRQGEPIGRHEVRFARRGPLLEVSNHTEVEITAALFTLYAVSHRSREVWRGDRLVSFAGRTFEDGTLHEASFQAGQPKRDGPAACRLAAADRLAPGTFWGEHLLSRDCLVDPIDGARAVLDARFLGLAMLPTAAGDLAARHYRLAGGDYRELWFDAQGLLVKMRLRAPDGSAVEMERVSALEVAGTFD